MFKNYVLLFMLGTLGTASLPAQFVHEPSQGDPYLYQPAFQVDHEWNLTTQQWDSLEYGTLTHNGPGQHPDIAFRPTVGSRILYPQRFTYQYDVQGRLVMEARDVDSSGQGNWIPQLRQQYSYIPNYDLISSYLATGWNGTAMDTLTGYLWTYILGGPLGQPTVKSASYYTSGVWSTPVVLERYHYSAASEIDTLWYDYEYGVDSMGYEKHVFHSWHDYANRLVDSATVYTIPNFSRNYELSGTHRTTYNGNVPQHYRHDKYEGGTLLQRRIITLVPQGYYELDSIVDILGAPVLVDLKRYEIGFDSLGRLGRMIKRGMAGPVTLSPLTMSEYLYLATSTQDASGTPLQVSIWPNPASDVLHIHLPEGVAGAVALRLVDMNGRIRLTQLQTMASPHLDLPLNQDLAAGTYILQVQTRQGEATLRVVLSR